MHVVTRKKELSLLRSYIGERAGMSSKDLVMLLFYFVAVSFVLFLFSIVVHWAKSCKELLTASEEDAKKMFTKRTFWKFGEWVMLDIDRKIPLT